MKKLFYSSFAVLFAAIMLSSCNSELVIDDVQDEDLVEVTIIAGNPSPESLTKTEMYEGDPYWSKGDAIGVTDGTSTNYKFTTGITERATTASFTGTTSVSSTLYAYYPHSSLGTTSAGARTEIPANQYPTATSFDGNADVMFSKQFTVSPASTTVSGLEFARAGAILKVVLKDNTTGTKITGQHPSILSLTATNNLVGRVALDVVNQEIGDLYGNQSKTVNANYSSTSWFAINGTNGAYIIVYPQTLAEGSSLTVYANTEGYAITKAITIPSGGIKLDPGKITTLNIGIGDANVVADPALTLPCGDSFVWLNPTGTNGNAISSTSSPALDGFYSTCDKVYFTDKIKEVKLGNSSTAGYLTTVGIDLSSASHITVSAKQYNGSDGGKIVVSVDGCEPITATNDGSALGASYKDYVFNLPAATAKSKVTIATDKKRAYVNSIFIEEGAYVPPAVLENIPYNNTLISSHSGFTISNASLGGLEYIWSDTSYGVQASANGSASNSESYLVSPQIDLSGASHATLSIDHSIRYFADVATAKTQATLEAKVDDGDWTTVVIPTYPTTQSNTFVGTTANIDDFCGGIAQFRFKYLATTSNQGRWQIKNFLVKEAAHGITASTSTAVIGGTTGNSVNVTATSDYEVSYSTTGSGFSVTQNGRVFTLTATGNGGASETTLGTLTIKEFGDASVNTTVTVKQGAAASGETLPFNWDGGSGDGTANMTISAGSDYGSSPKVKFQTANSHYIIVRIASAATKVSFTGKNNGTADGNHVTLQGSVDGSSYADIQEFVIGSGTQTYTSTNSISSTYRYLKLVLTTKATSTNTAMGSIHIE